MTSLLSINVSRILCRIAVCLVIVPVSAATADMTYTIRESAAPCLRLRENPSSDAPVMDCIPTGVQVDELEAAPFWRQVRLDDGRVGWAAKKFLEPTASTQPAPPPSAIPADAFLEVHFVDVGQGDGIWIHTYDDGIEGNGVFEGTNIIIDGGPDSSDSKNEMLRYLRTYAHHNAIIDTLIVSHPHIDHYPGAEGILRHFDVRRYYDPGFPKEGPAYAAFLAQARAEEADGQPVHAMISKQEFEPFEWGRELTAEVLYSYPGSDDDLGTGSTLENNASIVLRLQYGQHVFLFMGDAEGKDRHDSAEESHYVEKVLLNSAQPQNLRATVLKIAHHGSETSSTLPFIEAVSPSIVIVQSGRKSFSGTFLPDVSTLERYCCHDPSTRIYRTDAGDEEAGLSAADDADGDHVVLRTNGESLQVVDEDGNSLMANECSPACSQ